MGGLSKGGAYDKRYHFASDLEGKCLNYFQTSTQKNWEISKIFFSVFSLIPKKNTHRYMHFWIQGWGNKIGGWIEKRKEKKSEEQGTGLTKTVGLEFQTTLPALPTFGVEESSYIESGKQVDPWGEINRTRKSLNGHGGEKYSLSVQNALYHIDLLSII